MKRPFLLFVLVCLFHCSFSQIRLAKDSLQRLIHWEEGIKLSWDDFIAEPDSSIQYDAISHFDMGVKMRQDERKPNIIRPIVYFAFDKTKSWTRDKKNEALLKHEQVHFDIVELISRQLRKELKELEGREVVRPEDTYVLIRMYKDKLSAIQSQYDKETNHSILAEKQQEWERKIAAELILYKDFHTVDIELFVTFQ